MSSSSPFLSLVIDAFEENEFFVLASSPVGEARGKLVLPFDVSRLETTLTQLEKGEDIAQLAREFGIELYKALFDGELGVLLAASKSVTKPTESLNLKIQFNNQAAHLARLPWELLHDGAHYLVSSGWINLIRYMSLLQNIPTTTVSLPLRVLVIISRPLDVPPLDSTLERDAILRGLHALEDTGNLIVDFLRPPTHDRLVEVLSTEAYDAIHFDGHGAFLGDKGYLVFENEYVEKDLIDAETISNTLSRTNTRLIVLSACQSASVTRHNVFASVAPALTLAGIPAVVAMQFSIPAQSAIKFAQQFYTSIANFDSINYAVMQGRKTLFPEKNTWFIPVLYLRSKSDVLFRKGRKAKKPARKTESTVPKSSQIPQALHFVGRGEEIARLAKVISSPRSNMVVVWGSGGIGKTTLVSEYVKRQDWRFPDGVIWISLIGIRLIDTILDGISIFLTGKGLGPIPIETKKEAIHELLDEKRVLIVLDNFETVEDKHEIRDFVTKVPESVKVLITSRNHPKTIGWQSIELYKLSDHELLELFIEIGADLGTKMSMSQDFDTVKEICGLLDGHPLALELIMPMTISTPLASILNDLRSHPVRGIPSVLDISFNVMGKDEQTLLTRISVFDSRFDEQAIQAVSGMGGWRQLKDELVRRSFVHFDGTRFVIHPVIRQYAYQKLDNQEDYHLLAAEYFQNTQDYFPMVDQLYYAQKWKDVVSAMHQLTAPRFMHQLPQLGDLLGRLSIALDAAKNTGDPRDEAMIEGDLGNAYNQSGQSEKALIHFRNAYKYGKTVGDLKWQSQGLNFLATTYVRLGKDKEAIACQSESVEIGRRLGDKEVLAFSLSCLGDTYFMLGRFGQSKQGNDDERQEQNLQEAIKAYEQTIELFKEIGETNALAQPYTNLGSIYSMLENYPKAAEYLEKSVAIKLKQGDRYGLIASSFNLCNVYEHLGDYVQARKHIDAIITMHTDGFINVQQIFPKALAARGRLNFAMKQVEPAIGDYVLACFSSLEFGLETLLEMIEEVEKRVDKLVESGKTSQATTLCSVLIEIWRDKGFVEIAPQLVQRLEKKISLTS